MEYHWSPMILRSWFISQIEGLRPRGFFFKLLWQYFRPEGFGLLL